MELDSQQTLFHRRWILFQTQMLTEMRIKFYFNILSAILQGQRKHTHKKNRKKNNNNTVNRIACDGKFGDIPTVTFIIRTKRTHLSKMVVFEWALQIVKSISECHIMHVDCCSILTVKHEVAACAYGWHPRTATNARTNIWTAGNQITQRKKNNNNINSISDNNACQKTSK